MRRMKVPAPAPPQAPQPAPRHLFRYSAPDGGGTSAMDVKENILRPTIVFQLTLPHGYQVSVTEDGSKPLMDLLVDLCGHHHLNPSMHTLELLSPEGHSLGFKPNALLGSFNVACVLIKEKVVEDKVSRRPAPKVPEKTVRLMVNFHGNQKAVLRVNPLVPLQALIPAICDKCDFDPAHVLLLKDCVSRHELPLDKSLTELGIKELYVHDQSLVLQPKMASAPVLNNSDSFYSSTTSLGRPQKKGLLNIFPFSKRKSKTDNKSLDMDDFDDIAVQNSDSKFNGLSTVSGVSYKEEHPGSLEQSQSFTDIPTMHAKAESKKRRAPAPPAVPVPSQGNTSFKSNQEGPSSEGQRKRKAPPPPPTPSPIALDSDDPSTTVVSVSKPRSIEIPTPVPRTRTPQSPTFSDDFGVMQAAEVSRGEKAPKPLPVRDATPPRSSPSPSSSTTTTDSLVVQDSSSELSRSLDDSDVDLDQAGSRCSTSSAASGPLQVQPTIKKTSTTATRQNKEKSSDSSSRSDSESALNLALDEAENNRHSGMGWLHSKKASSIVQKQETTAPEAETLSLGGSSVGSSLPDQGYTPSEGAAEGEDSGIVSSPSDTQMTSPEGSLSADGKTGDTGERVLIMEASSDSDEENTTWGEKDSVRSPHPESVNGFKDDSELTSQLHQTLADLEADLAEHEVIISAKNGPYVKSTDSSDVPVSVVDMDVPVTAIDEVLEEFEFVEEHEVEPLTKTESTDSKGSIHHPDDEQQNQNNSAYTAALADKISSASSKSSEKSIARQEIKSTGNKKEKKAKDKKSKEKKIAESSTAKEDTRTLAVKSSADPQKTSKPPVITADLAQHNTQSVQQKKFELPAKTQRSVSPGKDEATHKVNQISSSVSPLHGKITHNATSRFGMKTFTVVPPKPSVTNVTKTEPTDSGGRFAIKIDDQGNMVAAGIPRLKSKEPPKSEIENGTPVCENAKALWSSDGRKENLVTQRKGQVDKLKEGTDVLSIASSVGLEGKLKTSNPEHQKATLTVETTVAVKEDHKLLRKDMSPTRELTEVESKISGSNNVQRPSNKPSLPPPLHSDRKQQLNFVKPSRRTSSQYVASALAKYTPKTSTKPSNIPKTTDSPDSLKTEKAERSKKPVAQLQSSQASLSDITENDSTSTVNATCSKRSTIFPECISDSQREFAQVKISRELFENDAAAKKQVLDPADKETAKKNHSHYNGSPQIQVSSNSSGDYIKHHQPQTPSLTKSSALHSSFKPPTAPKTKPQDQVGGVKDVVKEVKLQSSTAVSDGTETPGSVAGVTLFGPVKKFKPVICKSVEKDTSLHSSLMEAIQTGGGKERLRKISTTADNGNKVAYDEEGNERSALLAALRSQNISRLKKTKSKAASEVERFRKECSKEEKTVESSPSPPSLIKPAFTPPPPPMSAPPPPPPPVFPQGKPNPVGHLNANAPLNPALAREALLEAIRSGSGAEKLRKVSTPRKTVQVNSRLGTIHKTSSTILQH
ncbi:protein cordon-bleu isoform X3 [Poecilia reticulata]|uniref:protein cordon-bleu isoform X3 n=1 Tax=Poecilia reticulata TaxID=8081 RepID=UPI0004A42611|nr:PREDICTED: protein cordon-bleu isoform X3 [Poecilia reticulata]